MSKESDSKTLLDDLAVKHGIQTIAGNKIIIIPDSQFDRSWTKSLERLGCKISREYGAFNIILPKDPESKVAKPQTPKNRHRKGGPKPTSSWPRKWSKEEGDLILSLMDPNESIAGQLTKVHKEYNKLKKPEWLERTPKAFTKHTYALMATLKAATDVEEPSSVVDNEGINIVDHVCFNEAATGKSEVKEAVRILYKVTPHLPYFAAKPPTQHMSRGELTELLKELEFLVSSIKKKLEEP